MLMQPLWLTSSIYMNNAMLCRNGNSLKCVWSEVYFLFVWSSDLVMYIYTYVYYLSLAAMILPCGGAE